MEYNKEEYISPHWSGFRRVWWIVAIILLILLLLMWLMGYGPGGKACQIPVEIKTVEKLVTAPDIAAPLIILNDNSVLHLVKGESYVEAGARAIDGIDSNLTVTTSGEVDTSKVGEYLVIYKVTDAAGNTTTENRKVIVSEPVDTAAPEITLNGESIIYLKAGEKYVDAGAVASDSLDGALSVASEGTVDMGKAGEYVMTYTVTDAAGNTATATRKVVIIDPDKAAPLISLNDASVIYLKVGEQYIDAGAKAVDANDGNLKIMSDGVVDTSKAGEYVVTYKVTDSAGNMATKTRKVMVVESDDRGPAISLNNASVMYLDRGDRYVDAGAKARDAVDGDVKVMTTGTVINTQIVGEYIVTYTARDVAGNVSTATRRVIVSEPAHLIVTKVVSPIISEPTKVTVPSARLYFGLDQDNSPADHENMLELVVAYLKNNSKAIVFVSGFHDPSGNYAYNQDLSYRRAEGVSSMLKAAGIPADRIILKNPVETTGTGSPKEARRVEVTITIGQ